VKVDFVDRMLVAGCRSSYPRQRLNPPNATLASLWHYCDLYPRLMQYNN